MTLTLCGSLFCPQQLSISYLVPCDVATCDPTWMAPAEKAHMQPPVDWHWTHPW